MKPEEHKGFPCISMPDAKSWRAWLKANHEGQKSVWLILYHKGSGIPSIQYPEVVDEALCFGWIDSKPNKRDEKSYYLFLSPRNPKSRWSLVNKKKVEALEKAGKMHESGLKMIELAKANGNWDALNEVDALLEPKDLLDEFSRYPPAKENWEKFPPSTRRGILEWILSAKREETRVNRIKECAELASQNIRANQYKPKS